MHILVTADTVGGVWTYTRELVSGLASRGHRVTLVSFGKLPVPDQLLWMEAFPSESLEYIPTEFPLEWMQDAQAGIAESQRYLETLVRNVKPDILHSSQFCYGTLDCGIPKLVVAHSDVLSWWHAVNDGTPPKNDWLNWYTQTVSAGLYGADTVVAPSQWMLDRVTEFYGLLPKRRVIHNGRNPALFDPSAQKNNQILSVGRIWDEAKQTRLLVSRQQAVPVQIVGSQRSPEGTAASPGLSASVGVQFSDSQSESALATLFAKASIYVATSRYEPFGLAPVEAALSRCALVVNDIETFRQVWGASALYFERNNPDALAEVIKMLASDRRLQSVYAERAYDHARKQFDSTRMIDQYENLYCELAEKTAFESTCQLEEAAG